MTDAHRLALGRPALDDEASLSVNERIEIRIGSDAQMAAQTAFVQPDGANARAGVHDLADMPHALAGIEQNDDL